jgi:hypothetical protein
LVRRTVLVLAAFLVAGCSAGPSAGPPKPARYEPVGDTVLVSADGRVITAVGRLVCGHAQRLVARSYPDKIAVIFENPDRNCKNPGDVPPLPSERIAASARLPVSLGNRALIRVGQTRGTLPYFSERDLASIRRLPFGLRLSSDKPGDFIGPQSQGEISDIRRYMSPKALMEVTQFVPSPSLAARPYWFGTRCPILLGWHPPRGGGHCRTVNWITHGYRFIVGMAVAHGMTLSKQDLRKTAEGILVSARQYQ